MVKLNLISNQSIYDVPPHREGLFRQVKAPQMFLDCTSESSLMPSLGGVPYCAL
jgi:hypothetical protein